MTRVGIYFRVKEGCSEAYAKAHANIWPGMREVLNEAGICNYSIWNLGEMLFAYYEVEDMKHMNQVLASSEIYKKWRIYMEDFIYIEDGTGRKEWPMEMVFINQGNKE